MAVAGLPADPDPGGRGPPDAAGTAGRGRRRPTGGCRRGVLSAAGLAGWCGYLWSQFGNPLAFVAVQAAPGWTRAAARRRG